MSDRRDDGGPAFPSQYLKGPGFEGMTLHDYHAGQALAGLVQDKSPGPAAVEATITPTRCCATGEAGRRCLTTASANAASSSCGTWPLLTRMDSADDTRRSAPTGSAADGPRSATRIAAASSSRRTTTMPSRVSKCAKGPRHKWADNAAPRKASSSGRSDAASAEWCCDSSPARGADAARSTRCPMPSRLHWADGRANDALDAVGHRWRAVNDYTWQCAECGRWLRNVKTLVLDGPPRMGRLCTGERVDA